MGQIQDVDANGDAISYGSDRSGGNHSLASTIDATKGAILVKNGETLKPESTSAFILPQTGSANPIHSAPEGTLYWSTVNNKLYINNDGSTGWEALPNSSSNGTIVLTAKDFDPLVGSPALTSFLTSAGSGQGYRGWALDGGTDEAITANFRLPSDWDADHFDSIWVRFVPSTAPGASKAVRMGPTISYNDIGDVLAGSGTHTADTLVNTDISSVSQWQLIDAEYTGVEPAIVADGNSTITLTILRRGGQAADTYASDIIILEVALFYDARLS